MQSSAARCIRSRGCGLHLKSPAARRERFINMPKKIRCNFSAANFVNNGQASTNTATSLPPPPQSHCFSTGHNNQHRLLSATSNQRVLEQRRHDILTHALQRVNDEGWTEDAIATGTLDAGLPPSYIGQASSATSPFGSADLVAFFMEECNKNLGRQLMEENNVRQEQGGNVTGSTVESVSLRINKALQMRLSMVLPFVTSNRWHEGMAIGALPQNAYRTAQQLDGMATIVLEQVLGKENSNNPTQRAAIVAAYAAAELHLLSDGKNGIVSGNSLSLSGERYHATWTFLEARSAEVTRFIVDGVQLPSFNGVPLPNPNHVMAASAVASSLAGAALSLAAPSAAAVAGNILPRVMASVFGPLQNALGSQFTSTKQRDGTRPSDYAVVAETLPPFDASEEIFPESKVSNLK